MRSGGRPGGRADGRAPGREGGLVRATGPGVRAGRFRLRLPHNFDARGVKIDDSFTLFNVTMRPVLPWLYFNDLETTKTTYVHHFPTLRMTFWLSRMKLFAKSDPFITLEFVKIKFM